MKRVSLLLTGALLAVSLLGGCVVAGPAQSTNPPMESTVQRDVEANGSADNSAADDMDMDFELWTDLWQSLPHHDKGDNLAAIRHYGTQLAVTDLDYADEWDLYNNSNEGPYYVVIPKYKRSTIIVEGIRNHNGDYITTGEVFRKENAPDRYVLIISNPFSEGDESLRVTVTSENRSASFNFFYAAAIDPFPYMDNGILHLQSADNAYGSGDSPQADDTDVFGQTNEFGGGDSPRANDTDVFGQTNEFGGGDSPRADDSDVFGQTNEFGGGDSPRANDSDVFGQTNEFGGGTSQRTNAFDSDIFGQTNEFGGAQSRYSGKTLYARYETERDLPAATREEQRLIDTYLIPYSASGLYQITFTPEYMNEMSAFTLTIMFDSLCHQFGGYPSSAEILPGGRVAGDVFEAKLMKHLPLSAQMIRKICTSYNPADGTYELSPGIGSAPTYYVITEYVELDSALRISYAHYGLAPNETDTGDIIQLYGTGVAVINRTNEAYAILGNLYEEV